MEYYTAIKKGKVLLDATMRMNLMDMRKKYLNKRNTDKRVRFVLFHLYEVQE